MSQPKRKTLVLIIEGNEPESVRTRLMSSSLNLAQYVSADLKVLIPSVQFWPNSKIFSRKRRRIENRVEVTAVGEDHSILDELKSEIRLKQPKLLILERNHLIENELGQKRTVSQRILSELAIPVLLLSGRVSELRIPFLSIFVPLSGELRSSPALEWSINFANEMKIPVDLLHVTQQAKGTTCDSSLIGKIGDQFYLEYPYLVSEFLAQGSPYSSMREREVIRHFMHCAGAELDEIIKRGKRQSRPLVVIEWKGNFEKGHAKVLKGILAQTDWPILLTRQRLPSESEDHFKESHAA